MELYADTDGRSNLVTDTDAYKLSHWNMYPEDAEIVYSYFESRVGAHWNQTMFFGLQYYLKRFLVPKYKDELLIGIDDIDTAKALSHAMFSDSLFNEEGWRYIVKEHGSKLPLRIKAVPEGLLVPEGNVMMTVENTDPEVPWLTNAMETMLTRLWYPSTVATKSYWTQQMMKSWLEITDEPAVIQAALVHMLHDFGSRGASSQETAAIGGAAHLATGALGTDTVIAMILLSDFYNAQIEEIAATVPATEHSVMTALGYEAEFDVVERLLDDYPTGILSIVADSYDIYKFVEIIGTDTTIRKKIMERDGKVVIRPDSVTTDHQTPHELMPYLAEMLYDSFGGTKNDKGYKLFDPHIGMIWGDGIDTEGINLILKGCSHQKFAASNFVFGMGGGLLQKVNRDTQRFAFKASAMRRKGLWHDVQKNPLDQSKASKAGRLKLVHPDVNMFNTVNRGDDEEGDVMETVFENGELKRDMDLKEVRANAK